LLPGIEYASDLGIVRELFKNFYISLKWVEIYICFQIVQDVGRGGRMALSET